MDLKDLEKLAEFYGVHPAALLLAPDEGPGTNGRQMVMADVARGPLTLALAATSRRMPLPDTQGLSRSARQDRLTLAAEVRQGPLSLAVQAVLVWECSMP
jgi:hypothetical protein